MNKAKIIHEKSSAGRWFELSLMEQLANIGSEVGRAAKWQRKDKDIFQDAVERALELFDLTLKDKRWKKRLREIARARELFCDAVVNGGKEYKTSLKNLEHYFFSYAYCAQLRKYFL